MNSLINSRKRSCTCSETPPYGHLVNTVNRLYFPNFLGPLVSVLTGFHCILNVVRLSVEQCCLVIFDNICMERTWIRPKVHLILRIGYEDVEERGKGAEIVCVLEGFGKSVRSRGGCKIWLKN